MLFWIWRAGVMNTAVHLLDRMLVITVCCAAFGAGCSAEKFKTAEVVGMNTVRVSAPEGSAAKVHPHYADEGAFQFEVKAGPNVFDIDLMKNPLATGRKAGRE